MELAYIWIPEFKNIRNQSYNFDNQYYFTFNKKSKELKISKKEKITPDNFFVKRSDNSLGKIRNVSAIIGENGSGKSAIFDYIIGIVAPFFSGEAVQFQKLKSAILIVKEKSVYKILHFNNTKDIILERFDSIEIDFSYENISTIKGDNKFENNCKLIYYSNIFDCKTPYNISKNLIDISTNNLIWNNNNYRNIEIENQIYLISSEVGIRLPFKLPEIIQCKLNYSFSLTSIEPPIPDNYIEFERLIIEIYKSKYEIEEDIKIYGNLKSKSMHPVDFYIPSEGIAIESYFNSVEKNIMNGLRLKLNKQLQIFQEFLINREDTSKEVSFVLVTNIRGNSKYKYRIEELIRSLQSKYPWKIELLYWDDIIELIYQDEGILQKYYSKWSEDKKIIFNPKEYEVKNIKLKDFINNFNKKKDNFNSLNVVKQDICITYLTTYYKLNQEICNRILKENPDIFNVSSDKKDIIENIKAFFRLIKFSNDKYNRLQIKSEYEKLCKFIDAFDKLASKQLIFFEYSNINTIPNKKRLTRKSKELLFQMRISEDVKVDYNEFFNAYRNLILLEGEVLNIIQFDWYDMSSGEKAMLNIFSRFYSIANLLNEKDKELIILIDEGESYFHPEWQRIYLNLLLMELPKIFKQKNIQIILTSNSPFVVSDLPNSHIIFLRKGDNGESTVNVNFDKLTFGSNIYDLLAHSFFLENGFIGEFSKEYIQKAINILYKVNVNISDIKDNEDWLKFIVNEVGEPIIAMKLREKYMEISNDKN